jgi:hypothetical protein
MGIIEVAFLLSEKSNSFLELALLAGVRDSACAKIYSLKNNKVMLNAIKIGSFFIVVVFKFNVS